MPAALSAATIVFPMPPAFGRVAQWVDLGHECVLRTLIRLALLNFRPQDGNTRACGAAVGAEDSRLTFLDGMRRLTLVSFAGTAFILACVAGEKALSTTHEHKGSGPAYSKVNQLSRVDFDGMADLVVDRKATEQHWLVREEKLPAEFCSVQEGGVTPDLRRLIRFTVTTPNIGDADVYVGDPKAHMDPNGDGNTADQDGMFEFASCHNHFHFQNYAAYRLIERRADGSDGKVWRSAKKGFCMLDTDPNPTSTYSNEQPAGDRNVLSCGTLTSSGFQGISHGWADTYIWFLAGQYFILDGGDGQAPVPPGAYYIEVTVNPPATPRTGEGCPLVTDARGQCHNFAESNYDNNTMRTTITIPDHPGREGHGPLKGSKVYDYEVMKGQ